MTGIQLERTCNFLLRAGFDGVELSDYMQEDVVNAYKHEQESLIYFGAIDAPAAPIGQTSSEFNETPDMVGEICPDDYEFTMREFFELTFA